MRGRRRDDASHHRSLLLVRLTIVWTIILWMEPSSFTKYPTIVMVQAFSPTIINHNIVAHHPPNGASSSVTTRRRRTTGTTHRLVVWKSGVVADMDPDNNNHEESSSSSSSRRRFMYMTPEQDELLKQQGDYEAMCMQTPRPLKPHKVRGASSSSSSSSAGGGGGFGGGKTKKGGTKQPNKTAASRQSTSSTNTIILESYAKALQTDGVVRIDNVLSAEVADALRDYLMDLRAKGTAAIESGEVQDSQERFADVLLNQNRCDLKIPLGPAQVHEALYELLVSAQDESKGGTSTSSKTSSSIVRDVMEHVFESYEGVGKDAELWELNCFMSNAGARRQLVHADVVSLEPVIGLKSEEEPIVLTCFVALQDIDATMGPTVWMPGTHTLQAHNQFFETGKDETSTKTSSYSPKDAILQSSKSFVGTLPKGACVIFDPRVLHCAGANTCADPDKTRALFYMSFKNPKIESPGCPSTSGYGVSTAAITMEELTKDLRAERAGKPTQRLQLIACFP